MSLDQFLSREYDFNKYNCAHFVIDVWKHLTGEDIQTICLAFVNSDREEYFRLFKQRIKLRKPESPCIVFMQGRNVPPHAGIFTDNRIFHLTEQGAKFDPISIVKAYYRLSYYK